MRVMAVASYPVEAAATRFRVQQFVTLLKQRGIDMTVEPFLSAKSFGQLYRQGSWPKTAAALAGSSLLRLTDLAAARRMDLIFVQREAMMFGPPLFEWLTTKVMRRPMVLDLDDATYVSYTSPTYGSIGKAIKWPGKTDVLIGWAATVVCGNRSIADYVSHKGARARIIPTVVDTEIFRPMDRPANGSPLVLGWIGTHSTFPYLESIFPVLTDLARKYNFRLKVIGAGKESVELPGVTVENLPWKLEREVEDFQSIDIGLYPIDEALYPGWATGKSGFKAIQYMAVGVAFVATPVGGSNEIGEAGTTHFVARTSEEWRSALTELIVNTERRKAMGAAGRQHVIQHYGLHDQADKLADVLREAAG
ncbi:MAG TPA: glycosyltransferase family 4 protein [Pyrinomonadaceae bacterium]